MKNEILNHLETNAKLTPAELAVFMGESEPNVSASINELEESGVICGYHTLINWEKTDREHVTALIEVRVIPARDRGFDQVAERIYRFDEVKAVYLMSGGYDLCVILEGKTMRDVAYFVSSKLATLESVQSTATHFVLKKYKDHGQILSGIDKTDERMVVSP